MPPSTPPGLEFNIPEHTGMMQGNLCSVPYANSTGLAVQSFDLPQEVRCGLHSPLAAEYPPLAPPSWPAPSCASNSSEFPEVQFWTSERVSEWLVSVGLGHMKEIFQGHRISGDILLDLSSTDLAEMGIQALGDRKRILRGIALLRNSQV